MKVDLLVFNFDVSSTYFGAALSHPSTFPINERRNNKPIDVYQTLAGQTIVTSNITVGTKITDPPFKKCSFSKFTIGFWFASDVSVYT